MNYTFDEYEQERLAAQGGTHDCETQMLVGALGLAGETGEVVELIKKHKFHGRKLNVNELIQELGDVLWYVMYTADSVGSSLAEVAEVNNNKLRKRYPDGFKPESQP